MIHTDGQVTYSIHGDLCVVEYENYTDVDIEVTQNIISYKKYVDVRYPNVNKYVDVLNETITLHGDTMRMFSESMSGVDFIAVVYLSNKTRFKIVWGLTKIPLNLFCKLVPVKPRFRFFTNRHKAINWIKNK